MAGKDSTLSLCDALKRISVNQLVKVLRSIEGKKDVVLEPDLMPQLDAIANMDDLKKAGVEKIYKLEPGHLVTQSERCIYLVRPLLPNTKLICEQITINQQKKRDLEYWIIYVPYKLYICESMLEQEGVHGYVTVLEFPLGFIPLDTDLLSLELDDFFFSYYVEDDQTWVRAVANALIQVQKLCGSFPSIFGQGRCAKMVFDMMQRLSEGVNYDTGISQFHQLIIIDREVDYASVLLTQLTYEGLLDDTFGIKCGRVSFGKEVTGNDKPVKVNLNSSDAVYEEIRDSHISNVFGFMKRTAQVLQEKFNERHGMDLGRMKDFVANDLKLLKEQQKSLALHIAACEVIMKQADREFKMQQMTERNLLEAFELRECTNYIEEMIHRQLPVLKSLKLLCLLSITQDGLSTKDYRSLATQFLQSYGHDHLVTLHHLKKLGILGEQSTASSNLAGKVVSALQKSSFRVVTKRLGLIPKAAESYDLRIPPDSAYVFNGIYVPFICKFVEHVLQKDGLQKIEDVLKFLPGTTVKYTANRGRSSSSAASKPLTLPSRNIFICFLGGVTYAEVAALRHLASSKGLNFVIATTSMINGKSLLQQLTPHHS